MTFLSSIHEWNAALQVWPLRCNTVLSGCGPHPLARCFSSCTSLWPPYCLGSSLHLSLETNFSSDYSSRRNFIWSFLEMSWNFQCTLCIGSSISTCPLPFLSLLPSIQHLLNAHHMLVICWAPGNICLLVTEHLSVVLEAYCWAGRLSRLKYQGPWELTARVLIWWKSDGVKTLFVSLSHVSMEPFHGQRMDLTWRVPWMAQSWHSHVLCETDRTKAHCIQRASCLILLGLQVKKNQTKANARLWKVWNAMLKSLEYEGHRK